MGYCKKTETAPMCAYMGPFSQVCEQALNIVGQFFEEGSQQPFAVVVNPVPVKSKDENEKQVKHCSVINTFLRQFKVTFNVF
jgi:hypothetical protein